MISSLPVIALAGQTGMNRPQKLIANRGLGKREQQGFIHRIR